MYEEALMEGKVLKEIDTNYMYMYSKEDNVVYLLHLADKRIFKSTFYPFDKFKLPKREYKILNIEDICID